ncbi:Protein of unknown function [Lactobacillus delbrueckii subsp. lactis]|nr:Putative uncharacterized protein [Lactobacillus delbrueckii subsp. lactis]CDR81418.1 Protein of unknown function [Lactobacillus delbrueckii subsp. lactis]CDR82932.1 Protein of unknown function [Lactobacillus delbrueckii subsp. lactis]CDR85759.1 Protein of unknown function [Lactobacillus delbrueckii subsp. lactis]
MKYLAGIGAGLVSISIFDYLAPKKT